MADFYLFSACKSNKTVFNAQKIIKLFKKDLSLQPFYLLIPYKQ